MLLPVDLSESLRTSACVPAGSERLLAMLRMQCSGLTFQQYWVASFWYAWLCRHHYAVAGWKGCSVLVHMYF
jgi:hypothetical protein